MDKYLNIKINVKGLNLATYHLIVTWVCIKLIILDKIFNSALNIFYKNLCDLI
jgi:hypothetical protein